MSLAHQTLGSQHSAALEASPCWTFGSWDTQRTWSFCISPESCKQGELRNPICAHGTLVLSLSRAETSAEHKPRGSHQRPDLYIQLWVHKLGFALKFVSGARPLIWLQRVLPILSPVTEPAAALAVRGVDRCFILEFGMTVQRNKVTQGQVLVNSDVESKVNCISWFFLCIKRTPGSKENGKVDAIWTHGWALCDEAGAFQPGTRCEGQVATMASPKAAGWGWVPSGEICGGRNRSSLTSLPTIAIWFSSYSEKGG